MVPGRINRVVLALTVWCWRLRSKRDDAHLTRFEDHALDDEMANAARRSITMSRLAASSGFDQSD